MLLLQESKLSSWSSMEVSQPEETLILGAIDVAFGEERKIILLRRKFVQAGGGDHDGCRAV